ncbi:MAG: endonuclease MutS2, partial [Clostridia bacterium]
MKSKVLRTLEFDKILHLLGEQAQSLPGKASCLSLVPKTALPEVSALLIETREAYDLMMRKGRPSFEGVTDVTSILNRLRINASLNAHELIIIRDLLTVSRRIREYLKESSIHDSFPDNGVKNTLEGLQVIRKLEDEIRRCIISPDEIADDASPRLLSIRKSIARNQDAIRDKLNDFIRSEKYRKLLQEPIITMRNGRYVIPVKQENKGQVKGMIHDSSSSGATLYIEPMEVVNINNKVNELKGEEKEEIEAILKELSDFASRHTHDFKNNQELLVYGDVTFAKASLAIDGRCTFPELNDTGQIRIKQGIHPLLDPSTAVPIDFHIGEGFKTLVITGPNTGGKTVSLKTVGLFTLMAQSGLGIPAGEGSKISIFQGVFADIGDEQSIEQNLSTFSSHMSSIISILKDV